MVGVIPVFLGLAASLMAAVSFFVSFTIISRVKKEFGAILFFISAISLFVALSSSYFTTNILLGAEALLGMRVVLAVPMFLFFACICLAGMLWQVVEQSEEGT